MAITNVTIAIRHAIEKTENTENTEKVANTADVLFKLLKVPPKVFAAPVLC